MITKIVVACLAFSLINLPVSAQESVRPQPIAFLEEAEECPPDRVCGSGCCGKDECCNEEGSCCKECPSPADCEAVGECLRYVDGCARCESC